MSALAPTAVLASIVWNMEPVFDRLIDGTAQGAFKGELIRYGVKEGALDVALNPALAAKLPPAATEAVDRAKAAIKAGTLAVPFVPAKK
jgi:basic membrane lipoprotein Med (substrate-binding protein (PBP1-ABC) superfamily)